MTAETDDSDLQWSIDQPDGPRDGQDSLRGTRPGFPSAPVPGRRRVREVRGRLKRRPTGLSSRATEQRLDVVRDAMRAMSVDGVLRAAAQLVPGGDIQVANRAPSSSVDDPPGSTRTTPPDDASLSACSRWFSTRTSEMHGVPQQPPRASSGPRRRSRGRRRAGGRRGSRAPRAARTRSTGARARTGHERDRRRLREAGHGRLGELGSDPAGIASAGRHEHRRTGPLTSLGGNPQ